MIGRIFFCCLFFLISSVQAFATNYADSDLSNQAGTNKNWHNSFWFFVCVAFLLAVAIIGYNRKFIKINRNYHKTLQ